MVYYYHIRLMLHLQNQQHINLPFFLLKSISKMATTAQRRIEPEINLYHHGLVKMLILNEMKERGWDWNMFMEGKVISRNPRERVLSPSLYIRALKD
jgi:hypothetical protein